MAKAAGTELLILHGSQTGTAEALSESLAATASERGVSVRCLSMDEYEVAELPTERLVVFFASTTGEGEVPDPMRHFWRFLLRKDLPAASLAAMSYATFGLGDSSYPKFNYAAKRLHRRLAMLGATPLGSCGLGDEQATRATRGLSRARRCSPIASPPVYRTAAASRRRMRIGRNGSGRPWPTSSGASCSRHAAANQHGHVSHRHIGLA